MSSHSGQYACWSPFPPQLSMSPRALLCFLTHLQMSLNFLLFYMNRLIQYVFYFGLRLTLHNQFEIRCCYYTYQQLFLCSLVLHWVNVVQFIHSLVEAVMNISVQIFLWSFVLVSLQKVLKDAMVIVGVCLTFTKCQTGVFSRFVFINACLQYRIILFIWEELVHV